MTLIDAAAQSCEGETSRAMTDKALLCFSSPSVTVSQDSGSTRLYRVFCTSVNVGGVW